MASLGRPVSEPTGVAGACARGLSVCGRAGGTGRWWWAGSDAVCLTAGGAAVLGRGVCSNKWGFVYDGRRMLWILGRGFCRYVAGLVVRGCRAVPVADVTAWPGMGVGGASAAAARAGGGRASGRGQLGAGECGWLMVR